MKKEGATVKYSKQQIDEHTAHSTSDCCPVEM